MFVYTVIILVVALILGAITVFVVHRKPQLKSLFLVIFAIFIFVLAVFLVARIMQPINFKKERIKRENAAIERLKDIRKAEESYKDKYGKYTASFDTLIHFIKTDSFELSAYNVVGNWDPDVMTKQEAIKKGLIERTIIKKSVRDSLFAPGFDIEKIKYIPYTDDKKEFTLGAGEVETGSQVKVKVFEAYALYDDLFNGMDRQEVINYEDQRYKITQFDGVKVGSLTEANNNAGNWEK